MPLLTCDPAIELNGHSTNAFLSSLFTDQFMPLLEKHGFAEIDTADWYPLNNVLAVLSEIQEGDNVTSTFVSIGMAAAQNAPLPAEVQALSPVQFVKLYEQLYPTRHRNGSPGSITVEIINDETASITLDKDVPYPDDVMYGVIHGYARKLTPEGKISILRYDDTQKRRELGGSETTMQLAVEDI